MKHLKALLPAVFLLASCSSCEKEAPLKKPGSQHQSTTVHEGITPEDGLSDSERGDSIKAKKPLDQDWDTYLLAKGDHYNHLRRFSLFDGNTLHFEFIFDSTAIYTSTKPENQADWNKLMGFSDCNSLHQTNSVRLVWRWYQNELQIGEYRYLDGEREYSLISTVPLNEKNSGRIVTQNDQYQITVNDVEVTRERSCTERNTGYWLFPYFGGDETAPHNISIRVRHITPKF